jgi:hypothetical protein
LRQTDPVLVVHRLAPSPPVLLRALASILALAGCTLDGRIPNATLACKRSEDCPASYACVSLGSRDVCCRQGGDGVNCGLDADQGGVVPDGAGPPQTDASSSDAGGPPPADAALPDDGSPADGRQGDLPGAPIDARDAPPAADAPVRDTLPAVDLPVDARRCSDGAGCPAPSNCSAGFCVPPAPSCQAIKAADVNARDGVYWIAQPAVQKAYCDMAEQVALCTESPGPHSGRTRDPSRLRFSMTSVLRDNEGLCEIWAVRAADADGFPLTTFRRTDPKDFRDTCATLGFIKEERLGACNYGTSAGHTNCGFEVSKLIVWGTLCSCATPGLIGNGEFDHYVQQGPIFLGTVMSSATGTTTTTCTVR